ncbi:MAG: hypothetical protein P4M14_12300 [Gammaproteobacteria bacterium]|nr:hypothetical protein [Gammaproteobacteria bacterium]
MNSCRGFVLITVLLFLQIFAILSLYALQTNLLQNKIAGQFWHKHLEQVSAEALLLSLEKNKQLDASACVVPSMSVITFTTQTIDWWQSVSCTGNFNLFQYYYVIERLGADACSYIEQANEGGSIRVKANFVRLTLLLVNQQNLNEKVMLQTVLVLASLNDEICETTPYRVTPGRQSWRELI